MKFLYVAEADHVEKRQTGIWLTLKAKYFSDLEKKLAIYDYQKINLSQVDDILGKGDGAGYKLFLSQYTEPFEDDLRQRYPQAQFVSLDKFEPKPVKGGTAKYGHGTVKFWLVDPNAIPEKWVEEAIEKGQLVWRRTSSERPYLQESSSGFGHSLMLAYAGEYLIFDDDTTFRSISERAFHKAYKMIGE
jgi:hypothetical protein